MMKKILGLVCLTFLISACSFYRINTEEVTTQFYPPKDPAQVAYIENVERPYEIIGFVTVNTERMRNQGLDDIISKMKKEAASLGGDAITNITTNASGSWKKVPMQKLMANAYIYADFTGTVIVFKDNEKK